MGKTTRYGVSSFGASGIDFQRRDETVRLD